MLTARSWLLFGAFASCIAGAATAARSDGPLRHQPEWPIGRPEVVIYIANEPHADDTGDAELIRLEKQVMVAAISDQDELISGLPRMPARNGGAIFSNALASRGSFLVWDGDAADRRWQTIGWSPARENDPLLNEKNLALALRAVATRFVPDRYNYVLIIKSLATDTVALAGPPSGGGDRGVTRGAFFTLLSNAGKAGMHFTLVYLDTLSATGSVRARQTVPENVAFFYGPSDFTPASDRLSYARALSATANPDAFVRKHPSLALVRRLEAIRVADELAPSAEGFASWPDMLTRAGGVVLMLFVLVAAASWIGGARRRIEHGVRRHICQTSPRRSMSSLVRGCGRWSGSLTGVLK